VVGGAGEGVYRMNVGRKGVKQGSDGVTMSVSRGAGVVDSCRGCSTLRDRVGG